MRFVDYPDVTVKVTDLKGNTFDICQRVVRTLREAGVPEAEIEAFVLKAARGNRAHFLNTLWQTVELI